MQVTHSSAHATSATAKIKTSNAQRYLNKLCKHFSHKVTVKLEELHGIIDFSIGVCEINVNIDLLIIYCGAENSEDLQDIMETISRHLDQFSNKESLSLSWVIRSENRECR